MQFGRIGALPTRVVAVASFRPPLLHSLPPRSIAAPALVRMASNFRNPHNLPTKVCEVCDRPFTWRKKWENCWDEVRCCSKRCQSERKGNRKKGSEDDDASPVVSADAVPTVPRGRRKKAQARMSAAAEDEQSDSGTEQPPKQAGHGSLLADPKAARKAARKAGKAERRAVREGRAPPGVGRKACDLCERRVDLLVRCQVRPLALVCMGCTHRTCV